MEWININKQRPTDGQIVLAYFDVFDNIEIYQYKDVSKCAEEDGMVYGHDMFFNNGGFLTDDIEWWMPLPDKPFDFERITGTKEEDWEEIRE